jgi:hypothetical protein
MSTIINNPDLSLLREIMRENNCNLEEAKEILDAKRTSQSLKTYIK